MEPFPTATSLGRKLKKGFGTARGALCFFLFKNFVWHLKTIPPSNMLRYLQLRTAAGVTVCAWARAPWTLTWMQCRGSASSLPVQTSFIQSGRDHQGTVLPTNSAAPTVLLPYHYITCLLRRSNEACSRTLNHGFAWLLFSVFPYFIRSEWTYKRLTRSHLYFFTFRKITDWLHVHIGPLNKKSA